MPNVDDVYAALREVRDPELGINIVDLGLVYEVALDAENDRVEVDFTVTYPGCPAAVDIFQGIIAAVKKNTGVKEVKPRLVWQPPWDPALMSEEARLELGYPI